MCIGADPTFATLYTRINQKRGTTTIANALMDLHFYIHEIGNSNSNTSRSRNNKKGLVDAMKHHDYLYCHRLTVSK
jgi:hypothetical protein